MAFTVTIGSWAVPLAITLAAFAIAIWRINGEAAGSGMFAPMAGGIAAMVFLPVAAVVSFFSWLIWALIA